jgi:UDP-N-acetylmuramoylalanine--D-glutamate ligase
MMPAPLRPPATPDLRGARVVVAGAARSGLALARFLLGRGARVTLSDARPLEALSPETGELAASGAALETGGHVEDTFTSADLVAVSPGVPLTLPPLAAARERGVRLVAEVEVASWFLEGMLVGITGSNGKSTTTALLGHILASAGLPAVACGNLGTPLIEMTAEDTPDRIYVVELSSFQLEGIETFRPRVAALLNLSPDHQDRYPDAQTYYEAKSRLFMNQKPADHAVLNQDDAEVLRFASGIRSQRHLFSLHRPLKDGACVRHGDLVLVEDGEEMPVLPTGDLPLFGVHHQENVLAAILMAHLIGVEPSDLASAIRSFRGLPHRLERVREIGGVAWFNDSKATNVGATLQSLRSFAGGVVLILGGKDKGGAFADLAPLIRERVTHLVLMGAARDAIREQVGDIVPTTPVADMAGAVDAARDAAKTGGVVLLAPACASFDQYSGFEARGEDFRRRVLALEEA